MLLRALFLCAFVGIVARISPLIAAPQEMELYSTRSECAPFWQRIFGRDEEDEKKARRRPSGPSSTFFESDEVAAKKARQKAQIVTASSILWQQALERLERGDELEAAMLWERWIAVAAKNGIQSHQAHRNLAIAYYGARQRALASFHIVRSTMLQTHPVEIWKDLAVVAELERLSGNKELVSESPFFKIRFFANDNVIGLVLIVAFWLVLAAILIRWQSKLGRKNEWFLGLCSVALILFSAAVSAAAVRKLSSYGVLVGNTGISIFKTPIDKQSERLAELTEGAIVCTQQQFGAFTKISCPFSGWVRTTEVLSFDSHTAPHEIPPIAGS
ncbi:MAG: hypothetical protein HY537_01460 [Deltaproteobacteria bacterium]|nr:hypothetical protein [Deltaproteobacteria bacterium]